MENMDMNLSQSKKRMMKDHLNNLDDNDFPPSEFKISAAAAQVFIKLF